MGGARRVPNDPERRARIIAAALQVIVEQGVHRTTHRRIAAAADVPLGSLTYYFDDLTAILEEAFNHLYVTWAANVRRDLQAAGTREQATEVLINLICGVGHASPADVTALIEMYSFGNYNEAVRKLLRDWLFVTRVSLSQHFSPSTALALDVLLEGWPLQRVFEGRTPDRSLVERTVKAVIAAHEPAESERPRP
ncbi:TetR family transcriptional regulator [Kineosporia sp. NBRC 101677]|uniref:TetR/AcrR family transcriptional regulator n=1 Tax=Kineosporia sp. NBRC 101677 TaxID=3032197 RepID=UPI0024A309A7|nr:TetR family transcriptional regulator [Kineosporia sp. NBRC 101677]GLY19508.1 TetR family transcriptional regulator [Kineosporia sp. NBRC 101677]